MVEPSWDRSFATGQSSEPVWTGPTSTQAPAPSRLQPQREEGAAEDEAVKARGRSKRRASAPELKSSGWLSWKLFAAVVGLCVVAGLLWSMADVARNQVVRSNESTASAQPAARAAGMGQQVSGSVR